MAGTEEAQRLYWIMVDLGKLIENAETRREADKVFQAIVQQTDTIIASFIWDYLVLWGRVQWSEE